MTETGLKLVKVDNWGVFFLQRLHHFFTKNEFCDLILLFKNAERIKVHRVVLYACTEYFQVLERDSPAGSHLLRMPEDMDAEVVVPIINFMYTGRLEFKLELHSRLYSAAKAMSMSVLTKLLDAQYNSVSVQGSLKAATVKKLHMPSHTSWNLPVKKTLKSGDSQLPEPLPGRKLPIWKRRSTLPVITPHIEDSTPVIFSSPLLLPKREANARHEDVSGPMRFDWPDMDLKPQTYHPSFDDITYETKPLVKPADTPKTPVSQSSSHSLTSAPACGSLNSVKKEVQQTASFEEVRRTAVAIKRPSYGDSAGASPEKQPKMVDLQAVKEYVQEHQLRKDLVEIEESCEDVDDDMAVADYDDDDDDGDNEVEGEGSRDDGDTNAKANGNETEIVNRQQMPDSCTKPPVFAPPPQPAKSILKTQVSQDGAASSNANTQTSPAPKRVRFSLGDNTESSEGKENEAKVDTNVNTNINTKINTNINTSVTAPTPTREADSIASNQNQPEENLANHAKIITEVLKKYPHLVKNKKNIKLKILRRGQDGTTSCKNIVDGKGVKSKVSYVVLKPDAISKGKPITGSVALKHGNKVEPLSELPSSVLAAAGSGGSGSTSTVSAKIPLIVSRPMASGAENTTGPWLCYSCGNDGNPVNFETYYLYRRHLQDVHMEKIDARICEHCGHRASKRNLLLYHLYTRHNVPPPRNCQFPRCDQCEYVALSESLLIKHRNNHTNNREFVCKVCNATFKSNGALQGHIQANLHSDPAKKNYECPICHKPFVRNINLKAHLRSAHGDVARKVEKEEPGHVALPGHNVADGSCVVRVQQSKAGTVVLAPAVTVLASGPAGPVQTLVPSSEAEALSNVASGIAASLGLSTDALNGDQTVIVLDDNREYILGSTSETEVQDYVEEQMVQADSQEYIVPEIMSGEEVHPYDGTVVTTAGGTSFSTIVQRPTLNQAIVPPPIQVTEGGNSEGIGVVISDHDYANEVALRGMSGEGMMFIITQPGPNGNTILQTGHIAAPQQQHAEVYTHQIAQHLQHQFVQQQQQFREQKTQKVDQLCLQQQQQQQQQQQPRQQTAQPQVIQEKILQTVHQQKQEQHLPTVQQLQNKEQQLQPQQLPPLRQQQRHLQQSQPQPQQPPSELQVQVQAQQHQEVLCQQQAQEELKRQEQHLQHHHNCQVETLQHQQQLLQEQLLQEQGQEQSVQSKQSLDDSTEIHQELIGSAYLVQQNNISQEITNIITSGGVQAKVVDGTSECIVVSRTNAIISQDDQCVIQKTQNTDGGIRPVTVTAEQASVAQSIMDNVGISQSEPVVHSASERVKVDCVSLETDITTNVTQQVPVFDAGCTSNTVVQPEEHSSEQELVMAEMRNIVPDGAGDSYSAHGHITMPNANEARRMASDLVKDWDEFDEDSCDFVGSQLAQKNKDAGNGDSCAS